MKDERKAERLRDEIERSERGARRPFEPGLKRKLVEYARERRQRGASYVAIGEELGISWPTIADWVSRDAKTTARPVFRRVAVRPVAPSASIVVVHPSGVRVEGLDVASAADLLRRLST